MTFEEWWNESLERRYQTKRAQQREIERQSYAEVWNAALDAMKDELMKRPTWSFSPEQVEVICNVHFKTSTLTAR